MPKKGKGKAESNANPLETLYNTEEGRQRLKQLKQVALREEEETESKVSKINSTKLQNKWLETMRAKKTEKLNKELNEFQSSHEWRMENKTRIIGDMEQELVEAEEQMIRAVEGHLSGLKDYIDLQSERIDVTHKHFQEELNDVENEFFSERKEAENKHLKQKNELLAMIRRMEQEYQDAEADTKHEFSSQHDDIRNRNLEDKQALRIQMETAIDEIWKQFQKDLDDYNQSTSERRAQFDALKSKDQESAKVIEDQTNKLMKLSDTINSLRSKLQANHNEYEDRNKALRKEKEMIQHHFQEMKHKIGNYRGDERRKLASLAVISKQVVTSFQQRVELAENILKQMELTKKLETENEKIVAYEEAEEEVVDPELKKEIERVEAEAIERIKADIFQLPESAKKAMRRFYKRHNKAALDKMVLEHRKKRQLEENQKLKLMLQQYFDGFSVSEEVLEAPNSLFIVNGRSNIRADFLQHKAPPTVDGPLSLKVQKLLK